MSASLGPALRASPSQLSALRSVPTCDLSDALLRLAQPEGAFVGEAFTVQMVEASDTHAPKLDGHYVDLCPPERVMVIARPPGTELSISAMLGGLLATALAAKNVTGVILDGRCRDLAELRALQLPVLAKAHGTIGQSPFTRVSAVEVPIQIAGTRVVVNPWDIVVADEDGVVVVRPSMVAAVLAEVEKGQEADAKCLVDIKAGRAVAEAFREHRSKK